MMTLEDHLATIADELSLLITHELRKRDIAPTDGFQAKLCDWLADHLRIVAG